MTATYVAMSPSYRRGSDAAVNIYTFGNTPNEALLRKASPNLRAGFFDTWKALTGEELKWLV